MTAYSETYIQLKWAYHVIGAEDKDTADVIKKRYRLLVRQHHPDQFAADPDKQQTATKKLQEINGAYQQIKHAPLRYHISTHPEVERRYERKQQQYEQRIERYQQGQTRRPPPRTPPRPPREFSLFGWVVESALHFILGWGLGGLILFLGLPGRHRYHLHHHHHHLLSVEDGTSLFLYVPIAIGVLALIFRNNFWLFISGRISDMRWWW